MQRRIEASGMLGALGYIQWDVRGTRRITLGHLRFGDHSLIVTRIGAGAQSLVSIR